MTCQGADPMIFIIHSIDYCVRRGFDYEDPYILRFVMAELRVWGCTGILKMMPDKNLRIVDTSEFYSNMWVDGVYTKRHYFTYS